MALAALVLARGEPRAFARGIEALRSADVCNPPGPYGRLPVEDLERVDNVEEGYTRTGDCALRRNGPRYREFARGAR